MTRQKHYFFCGIGGSGMMPLALTLQAGGAVVQGSDRSLDQGRTGEKFDFLKSRGIGLFPQDGSGLTSADQVLVVSGAVEDTVPDVQAARKVGATQITRAELLSDLFNRSACSIGVAGTSGKSTTTGMIGWILSETGRAPTIVNGANMKNFMSADNPYASAVAGQGDRLFVAEVDESDGSIANYDPAIAVLNNIAFDHKSMDELHRLFGDFIGKAEQCVLNLDNEEVVSLLKTRLHGKAVTYSLVDPAADLYAENLAPAPDGIGFDVHRKGSDGPVHIQLPMPGAHNVSNALAAIAAAMSCGVSLSQAATALSRFAGIRRRLETIGTAAGVTVIDDFAHNPDKIAASLATLHAFDGRLLLMFQPHGFGPLRLMRQEFIDCFAGNLRPDDMLIMPEPVYYGGTVERTVSSGDIAEAVCKAGRQALAFADRAACGEKILEVARDRDRIVVMGARDDTLSTFAHDLLLSLAGRSRHG